MEAVGSIWWHGSSSNHQRGSRRGCIRQRNRNLVLCTLCIKGLQKVPSPCKQGRSDGVDGNIPARNKVSVGENLGCRTPQKRRHLAPCERILAPCLAMLLLSGMLQPAKGSTAFRASPSLRHGRSESLSLNSNMHDVEDQAIVKGHSKGNIAGSASLSPQFSSEIDAVHEMSDEDPSESGKALSGLMGRKGQRSR